MYDDHIDFHLNLYFDLNLNHYHLLTDNPSLYNYDHRLTYNNYHHYPLYYLLSLRAQT